SSAVRAFRFELPQPIPAYLLAFAVGDLVSRDISPRARVWAEPALADAAAWEFAEVEKPLSTAERLFGPYDWDRYDMLVLPPSFPYGGMENPCMTFLTPTLLAGDRSLVDVVAHELAHSWTGNLVSNATGEHFWLNEGWTVWAERRILEALRGPEAAALSWALGAASLKQSLARFGADSPLTKLRTELDGIDPDDAYSTIPYEKGALFLALLERTAGRDRFDVFVREYLRRFRFTAITTEEFLAFLDEKLPGTAARVRSDAWVYGVGVPDNAPRFETPVLERLRRAATTFVEHGTLDPAVTTSRSSVERQFFLQQLPRPLDASRCAALEAELGLTRVHNAEIVCEWLTIAARSSYEPAFDSIRQFLASVGRMKYLRPVYAA